MKERYVCTECERPLYTGNDCYCIKRNLDVVFCSEKCMYSWIKSVMVDEVIEAWSEENTEYCDIEEENPYARYGVSESDFI